MLLIIGIALPLGVISALKQNQWPDRGITMFVFLGFAIPGMGKLFYDAVLMRDFPVIMGILTIGAILTMLGNLLADVSYAWADPRVRRGVM